MKTNEEILKRKDTKCIPPDTLKSDDEIFQKKIEEIKINLKQNVEMKAQAINSIIDDRIEKAIEQVLIKIEKQFGEIQGDKR